MTTIALMSPGAMGASVGAAAAGNGHEVLWLNNGRSESTVQRAARGNLVPVTSEQELFDRADVVLSVCPPHSAIEISDQVARNKFQGIFVEANAISQQKTRNICSNLSQISCVDGGIIGGPAWSTESNTQLYLSGEKAATIGELFNGTPLNCNLIGNEVGSASALKMTFAAYSKGSTALLAAILAVAEQEGVRDLLQNQWGATFSQQTSARVTGNAAKAWRFAGEMDEISETFIGAGLPGGFHASASEVFERLSDYKDVASPPALTEYLAKLIGKE